MKIGKAMSPRYEGKPIDATVQEVHGGAMAQRVRRWLLAGQRRTVSGGSGSGFGDPGFDSVGGQPTARTGGGGGLAGCLVTVEVADDGGGCAFAWDRQHTLDNLGVLRGAECGVAKQRVDGGQAGVAGGRAVAPFGLQVVQESGDQIGVELVQALL